MKTPPSRILVLVSLLSALWACSSYSVVHTAERPVSAMAQPPEGLAKICVFRDGVVGFALTTPVRDNGEVVGATQGAGHFCYFATEGLHTITVEVSDADPFEVRVKRGLVYFIEHKINVGTDELVGIDANRAAHLSEETSYALIDETPDDAPVPALVPTATGH